MVPEISTQIKNSGEDQEMQHEQSPLSPSDLGWTRGTLLRDLENKPFNQQPRALIPASSLSLSWGLDFTTESKEALTVMPGKASRGLSSSLGSATNTLLGSLRFSCQAVFLSDDSEGLPSLESSGMIVKLKSPAPP